MKLFLLTLLSMSGLNSALCLAENSDPLTIAHRGASGYLPEHTLEAKALAHAQGADYIEQDVVMSKDNQLIVFHDLTLDRITDASIVFPDRARKDGHYYLIDFTLDELRQLQVIEGKRRLRYGIHTLQEEIELIQNLNTITGSNTGIYPELKAPWFHHQHGKDLARKTLSVLISYGYDSFDDPVFLQSFDYKEILRLREELLPEFGINLKLIQLLAFNEWNETFVLNDDQSLSAYDYDWMRSSEGLNHLATYVQGIGPSIDMIVNPSDSTVSKLSISSLVNSAHNEGLIVHPFTFRDEKDRIPEYADSFFHLLDIFINQIEVDGVFTDYPDLVVRFLDEQPDQ